MSIEQGLQQQQAFLKQWPFERLQNMTLEEYTNLNKEDAFIYWLEKRTEHTGSIWGGSAYKFGIYRRRNIQAVNTQENTQTDGAYAWYLKYGSTAQEAFETVKSIIVRIAKNALQGQFEQIDDEDFGPAIKWKIAFLYNTDHLLPIFKREWLSRAAESLGLAQAQTKTMCELQRFLMPFKPQEDNTLSFAKTLWEKFNTDNFFYVIEKFLKQAETDNLKKQGFSKKYRDFDVKLSFGVGSSAKIPWIAILCPPNTITDGIYPVYLFFKEVNKLVLAYGLSETHETANAWPDLENKQTISDWHLQEFGLKPFRYGSSLIKAVYDLKDELDADHMQKDLDQILDVYSKIIFSEKSSEGSVQPVVAPNYWLLSPGEGAIKWDSFYRDGIMGLGWPEIDNLTSFESREAITEQLKDNSSESSNSQRNNSLALWAFLQEMKPGDIVITKKGRSEYLGYGVVSSDYFYLSSDQEYPHQRKVDWQKKGHWEEAIHKIVVKTLTNITQYPDYVDRIKRLIGIGQVEEIPQKMNFWWLNANPKYWKIRDFEIGQEQKYTTHNEKGNKRSRFEYFAAVQPGDLIIGYESSPVKKASAVLEITQGVHLDEDDGEEKIAFNIQKFLPHPLSWSEIKILPEMGDSEVVKSHQGSLFKLTKPEFDAIVSAEIESEYPEYTDQAALKELFISPEQLKMILTSLEYKKNIILQGPPGTGKTFMAKRLAYLTLGEKDPTKIEMVQFHQSYAYEDFIQGFRPTDDGKFKLQNGVFYRFCKAAAADPNKKYFFIIDEINRGNLSKIFGELMLLLEADKRGKDYAVSLTYTGTEDNKFYIPDNLYLIGTMNTADRSLAVVDYALRRRFAFINVLPSFGQKFKNHLIDSGVDEGIVETLVSKLERLNQAIDSDPNLGSGFKVGHSYFCHYDHFAENEDWYSFIIDHEIGPLLQEYWFDKPDAVAGHLNALRAS